MGQGFIYYEQHWYRKLIGKCPLHPTCNSLKTKEILTLKNVFILSPYIRLVSKEEKNGKFLSKKKLIKLLQLNCSRSFAGPENDYRN